MKKTGIVKLERQVFQDLFLNDDDNAKKCRLEFFTRFHPYDATTNYTEDVMQYGGVSDEFEEIAHGEVIPTYRLGVYYTDDGEFKSLEFIKDGDAIPTTTEAAWDELV